MGQHKKLLTPLKIVCLVFSLFAFSFILNAIATNSALAAETKCLQFNYTVGGKEGRSAPVCMPVENGKVKISSPSDVTVNGGKRADGAEYAWQACGIGDLCTIAQYGGNIGSGVSIGFGYLNTGYGSGGNFGPPGEWGAESNSGTFISFGHSTGTSAIQNGEDWESVRNRFDTYFKNNLHFYFNIDVPDGSGSTLPAGSSIDVKYKGIVADTKTEELSNSELVTGEITTEVPEEIIVTSPSDSEAADSEVTEEDVCFQESGSLGWVICPVIFGLRNAVANMYEAIEPFIQVRENIVKSIADSLTGNNDGGILKPWSIFRNLANIVFVILFLFVIFSQLTGYGIDNYGIKKMLPKIIITAILVNLSLIVCAVAVDISNIIGKSIDDLFISNAPPVAILDDAGGHSTSYIGAIITAVLGAGIAGVVAGWTFIIPILLFLLTMAVSILFALIVLGVRQALVIILIVVAPLAMVCYILPNTEGVFKKWLKIFKDVLMIYPICGALIGAGYFASHVLLSTVDSVESTGDHFMVILSGLLCVVPYFFIPSLVNKSIDGVGRLGERISRIGNRAGSGLSRGIGNSNAVRNARQNAQQAAANRRANIASRTIDRATMAASNAASHASTRRGRALGWLANHTIASNGRLRAVQQHAETQVQEANQTARVNAQDAVNNLERMRDGGFEAAEIQSRIKNEQARATNTRITTPGYEESRIAGINDQLFEDSVKDESARLERDGTFDNMTIFRQAVRNAVAHGNNETLEALIRKATKGSDNQRAALRSGMEEALTGMDADGNQILDERNNPFQLDLRNENVREALSRYGNATAGEAIFKSQNRSMNDQGQSIVNTLDTARRFDEQYAQAANDQQRDQVMDNYARAMLSNDQYNDATTRAQFIQSSRTNGDFSSSINLNNLANSNFVGRGILNGKQSSSAAFNYDDGEFEALARRMDNLTSRSSSLTTMISDPNTNQTDRTRFEAERNQIEAEQRQIAEFMGGALWLTQNDPNGQYNNVKPETIDQIKRSLAAATNFQFSNGTTVSNTHLDLATQRAQMNDWINNQANVNSFIRQPDNGVLVIQQPPNNP